MALLLDPRLVLVWRTPTSLQIGVDHAVVTLHDVSTADERMLAALVSGISPSGLAMIGHSAGATDADIGAFLAQIRPALVPTRSATTDPRAVVAIDGHGPTVGHIASLLTSAGFAVCSADAESSQADTAAAVVIAHFVSAPQRGGAWLRRDVPHLPVIFGDALVQIGPFVDPGNGPCMHCVDLHHRDADSSWTAMASQLLGRVGPAETVGVAWEVATLAARLVATRLTSQEAIPRRHLAHTARQLATATGVITERQYRAHPECGCRSLSGNETADGAAHGSNRIRPRTAAANVSHA